MREENKIDSLWRGLWLCMSLFSKHTLRYSDFSTETRIAAGAFYPFRGLIAALISITPFIILSFVTRLDFFYTQLLVPFVFWGIMEKITFKRRLQAFCKCSEAVANPDKAAQIMHNPGDVPLTAAGASSVVMLICGKLMIVYLLVSKNLIASDNANQIQFVIMLCSIPVLSELGSALLLSGDDKNSKKSKPVWPVIIAFLFTLPFAAALWFLASPYTLIMPLSLVLIMVFYWKSKADTMLKSTSETVAWACYETCEIAAALGMLIVHQMPLQVALRNLQGLLSAIQ